MGLFDIFKSKKAYQDLAATDFMAGISSDQNIVILDVRTTSEFAAGHLKGAIKMDFLSGEFAQKLDSLDISKSYYVYCRSGNRSSAACKQLAKVGCDKVYNLIGGYGSIA
jgi:rhodanese-related sulfurtransferase